MLTFSSLVACENQLFHTPVNQRIAHGLAICPGSFGDSPGPGEGEGGRQNPKEALEHKPWSCRWGLWSSLLLSRNTVLPLGHAMRLLWILHFAYLGFQVEVWGLEVVGFKGSRSFGFQGVAAVWVLELLRGQVIADGDNSPSDNATKS